MRGCGQLNGDKEEGVGGGGGYKPIQCVISVAPVIDDFKAAASEGPSHTLTVSNIQARPINGCKQGRPRPLYILHQNVFL